MKDLKPGDRVSVYGYDSEGIPLCGITGRERGSIIEIHGTAKGYLMIRWDSKEIAPSWVHRRQCVPLRKKKKRREWWINEYSNGEAYLYTDPERAKYYDAGAKTFHVREVREGR